MDPEKSITTRDMGGAPTIIECHSEAKPMEQPEIKKTHEYAVEKALGGAAEMSEEPTDLAGRAMPLESLIRKLYFRSEDDPSQSIAVRDLGSDDPVHAPFWREVLLKFLCMYGVDGFEDLIQWMEGSGFKKLTRMHMVSYCLDKELELTSTIAAAAILGEISPFLQASRPSASSGSTDATPYPLGDDCAEAVEILRRGVFSFLTVTTAGSLAQKLETECGRSSEDSATVVDIVKLGFRIRNRNLLLVKEIGRTIVGDLGSTESK